MVPALNVEKDCATGATVSVSPEALFTGASWRASPSVEFSVQVMPPSKLPLQVNGPNGNEVVEPAVSVLFSPIAAKMVGIPSKANHVLPPGGIGVANKTFPVVVSGLMPT